MDNFVSLNAKNNLEYILIDGVCRSYITGYDGNEATLSFFYKGQVFTHHSARTVANKSLFNIQALTKVTIAYFSCDEFSKIMAENSEWQKWGRVVHDKELKNRVIRELGLVTMPAKERLISFRKEFAALENLIPHPYIASYLGISPVSLSRLRSQIL